jgi:hypothetical protein
LDKDDTISMDEMKAYLATVSYTHHHHWKSLEIASVIIYY